MWLLWRIPAALIGGVLVSSVALYLCDQYLFEVGPTTFALGTIGFTIFAVLGEIFPAPPRRTD